MTAPELISKHWFPLAGLVYVLVRIGTLTNQLDVVQSRVAAIDAADPSALRSELDEIRTDVRELRHAFLGK